VVDVMNDFGSLKNATKTLGHDETMLQDIAIGVSHRMSSHLD